MIDALTGVGRAVLPQVASTATTAQGMVDAGKSFAQHLFQAVQAGEQAAVAGVSGAMPMNAVVQKVMEAERAVTTLVSIRDKAVGSLLELTRMQV